MSEFSNFIRNASPKEKEEVFSRVIDKAIEDQKEVLDKLKDHDSGKKAINTSKVKSMIDLK